MDYETPPLYGLIGDPVQHSLSPLIHDFFFQRCRAPGVYLALPLTSRQLPHLPQLMHALDVQGLNVTAPHKIGVRPYLDRLDRAAKDCGAVNTIVRRGQRLVGYNTDGVGLIAALRNVWSWEARRARILIVGAGGAARAAAFALLQSGARHLVCCNRTPRHALKLVRELSAHFPHAACRTAPLTAPALADVMANSDLVLQTSAAPRVGALHFPKNCRTTPLIMDLRYGPGSNRWLDTAQAQGCRTSDGLPLLVWQAAYSFQLWTGTMPSQRMITAALQRCQALWEFTQRAPRA